MNSTFLCWLLIAAATTTTAVLTDTAPTEKPPNVTASTTPATTAAKPSNGADASAPRKRTIEQTVGYGYRYNSVLRPVGSASAASATVAAARNRATYPRVAAASPMTPSPTPASYYFQQQQIQQSTPKPTHRFAGPYSQTVYPRYNRPESSETRPVTENPVTANLQPHQDLYREVFTFDEAVPSPYHIASRAEAPQILPHALLLAPAGPHLPGHQHVIPVLILRLDAAAPPFSYPMMAMHILRDDIAKMYAPQDAAVQYADHEAPALAYYMPVNEPRRMPAMHQDKYRAQEPVPVARRPVASTSAAGAASQGTRTEVTIHHSPGMTAQDYKESVEQEEEA